MNISLELTGIVLAFIAGWALWFAKQQVLEMQKTSKEQAASTRNQELQTRAHVLLALDQRWESEPISSARAELIKLIHAVKAEAAQKWLGLPETEVIRRSSELYAAKLQQIRTSDNDLYLRLFQICGFFETLGYVAYAKYIPVGDVINLLGGSINTAGMVFKPHLQKLLNEEGGDKHLFEYFLWLLREMERWEATPRLVAPEA